jgi:hypothetical protein
VLRGHEIILRSARFHPDGTRVLTASHDGTARVFRVDWAGLAEILRRESTSCLTVDERVEHLAETRAEATRAHDACESRPGAVSRPRASARAPDRSRRPPPPGVPAPAPSR